MLESVASYRRSEDLVNVNGDTYKEMRKKYMI